MKIIHALSSVLICLFVSQSFAVAQEKYALVIGNSKYEVGPLNNPVNDATDIASKLESLGFNVTRLLNASKRQMKTGIKQFSKQLSGENKVGLFYFAGHGIESKGRNYLIPVNAQIDDEADLEFESLDAGLVLAKMELAGNGLNMVILDACRNNPYSRGFRSSSQGLTKMEAPKGSLLMYATSPGDVAADGDGRNGVFTQHFLSAMSKPGLKPYEVFTETATSVIQETHDQQRPYIEGYITGSFYFVPREVADVKQKQELPEKPGSDTPELMAEIEFWKTVQNSQDRDQLKAYLNQYPQGKYRRLAELKITKLSSQKKHQPKPVAPQNPFIGKWLAHNEWDKSIISITGKARNITSITSDGELSSWNAQNIVTGTPESISFSYQFTRKPLLWSSGGECTMKLKKNGEVLVEWESGFVNGTYTMRRIDE